MAKNFFKHRSLKPSLKPSPIRAPFVAALIVVDNQAQLVPLTGEISVAVLLSALAQLRDSVLRQAQTAAQSAPNPDAAARAAQTPS